MTDTPVPFHKEEIKDKLSHARMRQRSWERFRELGDTTSFNYLIDALDREEGGLGDDVMWAMVDMGLPSEPPLLRVLRQDKVRPRRYAAQALNWIGNRINEPLPAETIEPLLEALQDKDDQLRELAASCLKWVRSRHILKPLVRALSDPVSGVRLHAAHALARTRNPLAQRHLLLMMAEDSNVALRGAAGRILEEQSDVTIVPQALELTRHQLPDVRRSAIRILAAHYANAPTEQGNIFAAVNKLVDDPDKAVHKAAIKAMEVMYEGRR